MDSYWLKTESGCWVIEMSEFELAPQKVKNCPECKKAALDLTKGKPDLTVGGDIAGWRQTHECGAKILIIND